MRAGPRLEVARNEPIRAAGDGPADHRDQQGESRRQVPGHERRRDEGAQAADEELPVHPEVDEAGLERHRKAQAGEDEWRGGDQCFGHRSDGCRDVVGVAALDRGNDAARVADRAGDHRRVSVEHASECAADRPQRIGADLSQVLEVGQHDQDRAEEEGREQGKGRESCATEVIADSLHVAQCRRRAPSASGHGRLGRRPDTRRFRPRR